MKPKFFEFFIKEGWLTKRGNTALTIISLALIFVPLWLAAEGYWNFRIAFGLFCVGILLGAAVAYEGKAKQFGYMAPFTSDPLGWRTAKKTYEKPESYETPEK